MLSLITGMAFLWVVAFAIGPFVFIWATNTLFHLHNPFNATHYFAAMVILGVIGAFKIKFNKDE